MKKDRLETENLAVKPGYKDILEQHRGFLKAFAGKHKGETCLSKSQKDRNNG